MKKLINFTFALLLLTMPACAQGLPLVVDDAAILTQNAVAELSDEAQRLSDAYEMDVVILTTESLDGRDSLDFAADYYESMGYGWGEAHDGVMLMIAMEDRAWCILTTGKAINAFTDYGINVVGYDVVSYFSDGDFMGGFSQYLRDAQNLLEQAKNGRPFDINKDPMQSRRK